MNLYFCLGLRLQCTLYVLQFLFNMVIYLLFKTHSFFNIAYKQGDKLTSPEITFTVLAEPLQ